MRSREGCPRCGGPKTFYALLCLACYRSSPLDRLEKKTYREPMSGCWLYTGSLKHDGGYGYFPLLIDGQVVEKMAHRVAWILYRGPIPHDMRVLHRCDVPSCINPSHLFLGTLADNHRDMVAKKRHAWGTRNRHAKLSVEDVQKIRATDFGKWGSKTDYARKHDISVDTVEDIVFGRRWKYLTEPPK